MVNFLDRGGAKFVKGVFYCKAASFSGFSEKDEVIREEEMRKGWVVPNCFDSLPIFWFNFIVDETGKVLHAEDKDVRR